MKKLQRREDDMILKSPVAVGREGNVFLLAEKQDIARGEKNGAAQTHDLDTGQYSDIQPLQVWFKWGNWEGCSDADYQKAKTSLQRT